MTMTVEQRIENEKTIFQKMVAILKEHGWELRSVFDGEVRESVGTTEEAIAIVFNLDESWVRFKNAEGRTHSVYLILGNGNDGYDMIADYNYHEDDNFEQAMDAVGSWVEQQELN